MAHTRVINEQRIRYNLASQIYHQRAIYESLRHFRLVSVRPRAVQHYVKRRLSNRRTPYQINYREQKLRNFYLFNKIDQ